MKTYEDMLITIAIPTYNNEKTIRSTIESCLQQETSFKYEILIVNNASTDNTFKIINDYQDTNINIVNNSQTFSLFENHNICIKNATTKYIVFCHSDDTLEKHAIEVLHKQIIFRNTPDKYIFLGHSMFRDFQNALINTNFRLNEIIVGENAPMIFFGGGLTPSGTCYSRKSFLELGGFLETSNKLSPSDMTTMIYLSMQGFKFEMIDEMIFLRENASTARSDIHVDDTLNAFDDAFIYLFKKIDINQIDKLFILGSLQFKRYLYLYYAISIKKEYKPKVLKLAIKSLLKNPLLLANKIYLKIIMRAVFK